MGLAQSCDLARESFNSDLSSCESDHVATRRLADEFTTVQMRAVRVGLCQSQIDEPIYLAADPHEPRTEISDFADSSGPLVSQRADRQGRQRKPSQWRDERSSAGVMSCPTVIASALAPGVTVYSGRRRSASSCGRATCS